MSSELTDQKAADRELWAGGDCDAMSELTWDVGAVVAGAVPIEAGMTVLDVAGGTGSVAIHAAQRGAEVVGLDLVPGMLDGARRNAEAADVQVEWLEGDAEALPFEDESFDRVLTAFGTMFASDHDLAAHEAVRVCRAGGEIVMANWCPESFPGRLSAALRACCVPGSINPVAPTLWGTHGHVRRQLGGQLVLAIEPASVDLVFASVDAMWAHYEQHFGPLVAAKAELDPVRYDGLHRELRAWMEELDVGGEETRIPAAYLLVIGHKPVPDLRPNT